MPRLQMRRPALMPFFTGKTESDAEQTPPPARQAARTRLRLPRALPSFVWRALVVGFFVLGVAFLLLRHVAMPQVAAHRAEIEQALSRAVGVQVRIEHLDANWSGLRPELALHGLQFIDQGGRTALELPEVNMSLGWSSLWHWRLRLHKLEILRPELDIRREADGRIFVAGLEIKQGGGDSAGADALLDQRQILIRQGRVVWHDLQRQAPALALDQVELRLDNTGRAHRFALRASPPAESSSSLDLRGDLRGESLTQLEAWHGKLYLALDNADLAVWQKWTDYPLYLPRGRGGLRAWLDFNGQDVTSFTADVALADLSLRLAERVPQLDLASLQGRVKLTRTKGVIDASAERLTLAAQDGIRVGPTSLKLSYDPGSERRAPRGEFSTRQQDVQVLARLAAFLPLSDTNRERLVLADPAGTVESISVRWEGSAPGIDPVRSVAHFSVAARANRLVLHPVGAVPGFAGLDVDIAGSERAGTFKAAIHDGGLHLPAEMHEPWLPLARAQLVGSWSHEKLILGKAENKAATKPKGAPAATPQSAPQLTAPAQGEALTIRLDQSTLSNEHVNATVSGVWQARSEGPGYLDLQANAPQAPLSQVWRYIPHAAPVEVVDWLRKDLVAGTAENLRFRLSGDLLHFPFDKSPGVFKLETRLRDAAIGEFSHGWPGLTAMQGSLLLDRQRLAIQAESGRYGQVSAQNVKVEIPDLMTHGKQVLTVDGKARGPNADFLRYVNASELAEISGGFTRDIRSQGGTGELTLKLAIPLHDGSHTKVNGSYAFQSPSLVLTPALPPFTSARATLGFTEQGLSLPQAGATFLGRPVSASGQTGDDGVLAIHARGNLTVDGLKLLVEQPGWEYLEGETPVAVEIRTHRGVFELTADSTLAGIVSSLPAPYAKAAAERWPLRLSLRQEHQDDSSRDVWRVSLPGRADVLWADQCQKGACQNVAGAVSLGATATLPASGWQISGSLKQLDIDPWRPVVGKLLPQGAGDGTGDLNLTASVTVGKLGLADFEFRDQGIRARKRGNDWVATLNGPDIEGNVAWRDRGEGTLRARMKRLVLNGEGRIKAVESAAASSDDKLPALDVVADNFEMRGLKLGQLTLKARNEGGAWKLDAIGLKSPDTDLSGSGEWSAGGTHLDFRLKSSDAGAMLGRIGYADMLRRGTVDFSGKVSWKGVPMKIDYPSLAGQLRLDASDGQFREMEPGAGRLLGILSLQSLPRRISLDFRDVFSAGFAFDSITGDMKIAGGRLDTNDLEVRGPAARVFISGWTDLGREVHDLHIRIQPTLSETVAVGVIVGQAAVGVLNPAVGAATYLAQKLLRDPVEKIFSYDYTMRGSWADPKVEKVGGLGVVAPPEAADSVPAGNMPASEMEKP